MQFVGFDHVLGLRLNVQRVLEHVEDEREVDITEVIEVCPLGLIGHHHIIGVQVAVVPSIVEVCSCRVEEQVPQISVGLLTHGSELPSVEHVHEQIEVVQARSSIVVTLHVVARPEGVHIVIVD